MTAPQISTQAPNRVTSGPIVELYNVTKTYRQGEIEVHALQGLNLIVEPGEFTAISGPSGSGKSTALNLIGGLDAPTSGRLMVDGHDITTMGRKALSDLRRDRIGFVFQAYNLVPVLTAVENAEMVLALQGVDEVTRRKRVIALLDEVGLQGMANRRPEELSGGQQQRVAIARAIASSPSPHRRRWSWRMSRPRMWTLRRRRCCST